MRVALVSASPSPTSRALATQQWRDTAIEVLSPRDALLALDEGDVALVRLDIRGDLTGIEEGLPAVERLRAAGVRVLNEVGAPTLARQAADCARPSPRRAPAPA